MGCDTCMVLKVCSVKFTTVLLFLTSGEALPMGLAVCVCMCTCTPICIGIITRTLLRNERVGGDVFKGQKVLT